MPEQFQEVKELGLLVDKDDQGFSCRYSRNKLGDRPTVFIEIIQRIGCERVTGGKGWGAPTGRSRRRGGGFGKGELLGARKSIENYERTLKV